MSICIDWDEADFNWDTNEYTWDEVCLVTDVLNIIGGSGTDWEPNYNKLDKQTKEKFTKLIIKVKHQQSKIYSVPYEKEINPDRPILDVTIEDIKLVVKQVLNIDIKVTEK